MANHYDSDSSSGDYTETNVLLGYASKEAEEDTLSYLGGVPVKLRQSPYSLPIRNLLTVRRNG